MEKKIFGPRKRRTRQHIIGDLGVHHVEGFILAEGHTSQRVSSDYGYDLTMFTFDNQGYAEPGLILIQVKASEHWKPEGTEIPFEIDIRDYNL